MRQQRSHRSTHDLNPIGRLGRGVARHHRIVALVWVVVLVAAGWVNTLDKDDLSDQFSIPDTDSQAAYDLLEDRFAAANGASATVVFSVPDGQRIDAGDPARAVTEAVAALEKLPAVSSVSNPLSDDLDERLDQVAGALPPDEAADVEELKRSIPSPISSDGRVAYATVTYDRPITDLVERFPVNADVDAADYSNPWSELDRAATDIRDAGVSVDIGGEVGDTWNAPVSWWANHADEVGLAIGALLLLIAFGSLWGTAIPISTALFGAVTASGLVAWLSSVMTISSAALPVTLMISLGVGLDYSLLIVTRYRQYIDEGVEPHQAVGRALQTAGTASVFAGLTVCVALLGLTLVPIPLVQTMGLAAAVGVGVMILAATTLLPAFLGFAGSRIDALGLPTRHHNPVAEHGVWARFAGAVVRRPWQSLIGGLAVLTLLAAPFLSIQFGMPDDSSLPADLSQRKAFETMQAGFGPGVNAPLIVAVGLDDRVSYADALTKLQPVSDALGAERPPGTVRGVEYSIGPIPNSTTETDAVIYQITPTTGPDADATTELVERLRSNLATATSDTGLSAHVGGQTATLIDLTDLVAQYLPIVIGAVVLGAFLLLVLVFRSILVPLKAALLNLFSIAAAYGIVVAVFQWGWARDLVGLSETIPIVSFVPLIMFVILFGLSMDYEVFLMSRIKEDWDRTGDAHASIVSGVAGTARVITTAALIMVAVFLSFVTNPNPTVKLIGFGMAVAVLIDSSIVRMVLVPAAMSLLGRHAWWFPRWLSWLPHLDVEGRGHGDADHASPAPPDGGDPGPGTATQDQREAEPVGR